MRIDNDANKFEGEPMATATQTEVPELLTKIPGREAAAMLVLRQVELLTQRGRIAAPVYLSERSPRWRRDELLASCGAVCTLKQLQQATGL
jgi:hypothetical protein